ncbi:HdeD family acid-resistance protein [Actinoplanes sp. NPDC051411]|uniref:HdeD family acid-resistance protein n=1 Tax=Actinoplanes sp. NPDC051411 TaxID=3155522 RepID=UPI003421D41F
MLDTLSQLWWATVLRGVAAVIFGLLALVWPAATLLVLVIFFGAYVLVDGLLNVATAIAGGRGDAGSRAWVAVQGLAGIVIGVLTFAWPGVTTLALLWLIAAWAVVTGIAQIVASFRLRRQIRNEWLLGLGGVLSIIFGVLLVIWPGTGALAVITMIGIYALIYGVATIALGIRVYRQVHAHQHIPGGHRPATA